MSGELKIGLVGCGRIAERYRRVLPGISGCLVAAVADVQTDRAEALGARLNVKAYGSCREMLRQERLDLVVVLTPSGSHATIATEVA